jgi:hypothetical protein
MRRSKVTALWVRESDRATAASASMRPSLRGDRDAGLAAAVDAVCRRGPGRLAEPASERIALSGPKNEITELGDTSTR